ncbi:MAG TPA: NADH-quinone oxidoreductase subunit L [Gaiellaceae bacterium]
MIWGAWLCLASPLAAALLITLGGNALSRRGAGYLATFATFVAFIGAAISFFSLLSHDAGDRSHLSTGWTWIAGGSYHSGFSVLVDPLSTMMMLIVSGVGGLIIGYSIGYMDGDPEERRYFAYMALFVFSMLLLVQGGNLILLLAGWGMVGLSSYLLIGFWQERHSAIAAAKKAFVMNAVGDATMALAFFILIQKTGSLDFGDVFARQGFLGGWAINLIALGLLGGAVAKSAQLPLHTWLPDAMEGPTPVSALIHAATMVTAGVYLIVRTHPIFEQAPKIEDLAAGLGAATLVMAGLIALVQTDIKRVIAYSTMSQIGYMFLGAGLGAYANGMFHLMTHAFFKALLFMAAGIVIHALAGEQDMRNMGGLRELMPFTRWCFLIGSLALVGIFPFAGFFSKDSILAAAMDRGWYGYLLWVAGLAGTFLTGLYTFRMYFVVFGGQRSAFVREHFHHEGHGEGPFSMTSTVATLAGLAAIGGWIQWSPFWHPVTSWLEPVARPLVEPANWMEWTSSGTALALGLGGIWVAWLLYGARRPRPVPRVAPVESALVHKLYFDEAYDLAFYRPAMRLSLLLGRFFERPLIAGTGRELAEGSVDVGRGFSRLQTGLVRTYVLAIASSLAVIAVVFVAVR